MHAPSRRPLQAQPRPEQLAGPWKTQRDPRGLCDVTGARRLASGGHDVTGAICEVPELTWQAQDKGSLELGET